MPETSGVPTLEKMDVVYPGQARRSQIVFSRAAPGQEANHLGPPPMSIDCGSAEVFREEVTAYASGIWRCNSEAELHLVAGGSHDYETFARDSALARDTWEARRRRVRRP